MIRETFKSNIVDKRNYRIDLVEINTPMSKTEMMYKLMIKVKGKLVFVIRRTAWDFYLKELKDKGKSHIQGKGYFYDYGKGEPLKEFDDSLRDFTYLSEKGDNGVFTFCGNHEEYSGAFRYYIWDRKLVSEIRKKLGK